VEDSLCRYGDQDKKGYSLLVAVAVVEMGIMVALQLPQANAKDKLIASEEQSQK
jgi:hypothetical protein